MKLTPLLKAVLRKELNQYRKIGPIKKKNTRNKASVRQAAMDNLFGLCSGLRLRLIGQQYCVDEVDGAVARYNVCLDDGGIVDLNRAAIQ
jgi:hypothetical protein